MVSPRFRSESQLVSVLPQLGTEIQVGPTGKTLLPLTVAGR